MKGKIIKKISLLLVVAMFAGVIFGCGSDGKDTDGGENQTQEDVVIDFYNEINAEWIQENENLNGELSIDICTESSKKMQENVCEYLEDLLVQDSLESGSVEHKLATIYAQLKDDNSKSEVNLAEVNKLIDKVEEVTSYEELFALYKDPDMSLFNKLIDVVINANGGTGDYLVNVGVTDLYDVGIALNENQQMVLVESVARELVLMGYSQEEAAKISKNAMEINAMISGYYMTATGEYGFKNRQSIAAITTNIPLYDILESQGYFGTRDVIFVEQDYLAALNSLYVEGNLDKIKDFYIVSIVHKMIDCLPDNIKTEYKKSFYSLAGGVYKESETEDAVSVIGIMNSALGKYYAENVVADNDRERLLEIAEDVIGVFKVRVDSIEWLDDTAKEKVKNKLDKIEIYVGESGIYNDFSDADIKESSEGGNLVSNYLSLMKSEKNFEKTLMLNGMDRSKQYVDILDANLYYYTGTNSIVVCATMINEYNINDEMVYEEVLGRIGTMIAHEVGHAFDVNGCRFDEEGKTSTWWTDRTNTAFMQKVNSVKHFFDGMTVHGVEINGQNVMIESLADLTAVACCIDVLAEKEDASYEKYFTSYAESYRCVMAEEYAKMLVTFDNHLPNNLRVNGILYQFDAFYDTYNVDENSDYYVSPEERLKVW